MYSLLFSEVAKNNLKSLIKLLPNYSLHGLEKIWKNVVILDCMEKDYLQIGPGNGSTVLGIIV